MAVLLDGDALAARLRDRMRQEVATLRDRGVVPRLVTVTVGADVATDGYMRRKHADCREVGIDCRDLRLPMDSPESAVRAVVDELNAERGLAGFTLQTPFPSHLDTQRLIEACDPRRDADGKHPLNLGRIAWGWPAPRPCSAAGVLELLRAHDVPLAGRRVLLIGRGFFTGRPLQALLSAPGVDAVVTTTHRAGGELVRLTREADVVVAATGQPGLVNAAMIRPGAAVLGVGIGYSAGRLVSDLDPDVAGVAGWVTPAHGSVGPLTRAMLLRNVIDLATNGTTNGLPEI